MTDADYGWLDEEGAPERDRGIIFSAQAPSSLTLPERVSVGRDPWILDQGASSSCTGHMCAELIYGLSGDKSSPYFPWVYGRLRDGATPTTLANIGVRTSSLIAAYREHGSCSWERWRPGTAGFGLNDIPDPLARVEAQKRNLTVRRLLSSYQGSIALQIIDRLAHRQPCGLHVAVDDAFKHAGERALGPVQGIVHGHHVITAWFGRRAADGSYEIGCVNSWGARHGDGGVVWLSDDRVNQTTFACVAEDVS